MLQLESKIKILRDHEGHPLKTLQLTSFNEIHENIESLIKNGSLAPVDGRLFRVMAKFVGTVNF